MHEMAGWYGPFTLAEREIQKLWLRQMLAKGPWRTLDGRLLEVLHPGQWNMLEGPDFRQAAFRLDGRLHRGDVEIHFEMDDWWRHGHASDPRYNDVQLHVIVFPPAADAKPAQTRCGSEPATLVLLNLLPEDLESLATEAALLGWSRTDWDERLAGVVSVPVGQRRQAFEREAGLRWQTKVGQARRRLARDGWTNALHQATLECLGLARNREPMARLALFFPVDRWRDGDIDPQQAMATTGLKWNLRGVRPANHPRVRLSQYSEWWRAAPDWPEQLLARMRRWGECSRAELFSVRRLRRTFQLGRLRRAVPIASSHKGFPGEGRMNTWWTDVVWPLASVALDRSFFGYWVSWYPGNYPDELIRFVRESGVMYDPHDPIGVGLLQGALGWLACEDMHWLTRQ